MKKVALFFISLALMASCGGGGGGDGFLPTDAPPVIMVTGVGDYVPGENVVLDATGTYDPEGSALTFVWGITSLPLRSRLQVSQVTGEKFQFTPDVDGKYLVTLQVSDGTNVVSEILTITATTYYGPNQCVLCHSNPVFDPDDAGPLPPAPDVFTFYDGSWWDSNMGGDDFHQQGGHGDPDGKPPVSCDGCHDVTDPPGTHNDGVLNELNENTYHLVQGFILDHPNSEYGFQVNFDDYCWNACHSSSGVPNMRHENDSDPAPGAVMMGQHLTHQDAASLFYSLSAFPPGGPLYYDGMISTIAGTGLPHFVPCVACHDPHGTGVDDVDPTKKTNFMLRDTWRSGSGLCLTCHL